MTGIIEVYKSFINVFFNLVRKILKLKIITNIFSLLDFWVTVVIFI
jgi:hypothetical protein